MALSHHGSSAMRPIITLEDGTEVLKTTGDMDALEHGGGVLFREPRYREVYWTFWSGRPMGQKNFEVFTAPVPEDVIEFFDPDLNELSFVSGYKVRDMRRMGRSKKPTERLGVVMAIQECSGSSFIDPSKTPEIISPYEMTNRWGSVFGVHPDGVPMIEYEDFLIRESKRGDYECGCVDGTYLGRFDTFKKALCAVADHMNQNGLLESNLFHEHEFGKLELISWDVQTFIGKSVRRRGKLSGASWRNLMKKYVKLEARKKGIQKRLRSQKQVAKVRQRQAARNTQQKRVERAREFRRTVDESY
jgi:hypothetical protein